MKQFHLKSLVAVAVLTAGLSLNAASQTVSIEGDVAQPYKIDATAFAGMKHIKQTVAGHDGKSHEYSGVALYDIITKAGAVTNNMLRGKSLAKYVLVTAADNYQVVIALAEFDPAFTDQVIMLADQEDGEALPPNLGPYRLIVPNDKKPARSAMRVVTIAVQNAAKK